MNEEILNQQKQLSALGLKVACDGVDGPETQAALAAAKVFWGDRWSLPIMEGCDVSVWQDTIDWSKVAAEHRAKFAYVKASEGVSVDRYFHQNWDNHGAHDIPIAPYHFYRSGVDQTRQAHVFCGAVQGTSVGAYPLLDLPWMVDVEEPHPSLVGPAFSARLRAFIEQCEQDLEMRAIIYTGLDFDLWTRGSTNSDLDFFASRELWLAQYVAHPIAPRVWSDRGKWWRIWQVNGGDDSPAQAAWKLAGVRGKVDRNVLAGVTSVYDWASSK